MVTVYPKGTTMYKPEKCYNGYTLFSSQMEDLGKQKEIPVTPPEDMRIPAGELVLA